MELHVKGKRSKGWPDQNSLPNRWCIKSRGNYRPGEDQKLQDNRDIQRFFYHQTIYLWREELWC